MGNTHDLQIDYYSLGNGTSFVQQDIVSPGNFYQRYPATPEFEDIEITCQCVIQR
jgi:hypothetical protein